jgi:ferredoxin
MAAADAGGTAQLQWLPATAVIEVAPGQTLLQAALAAGLAPRSSCRNGSCRECRARLVQGRVRYTITWPGLSPDEKAEGWVLPCVALADSSTLTLQPLDR